MRGEDVNVNYDVDLNHKGRFCDFGGTKNGTSGAQIKIRRPLFNTN